MATEDRLIYANALFKAIKSDKIAWRFGVPNTLKLMFDYLRIIINEQPTVDAVEVVRCKDCTKWKKPWLKDQTCGQCTAGKITITEPMHFCAYGEREA